jgi:hypothetical protein
MMMMMMMLNIIIINEFYSGIMKTETKQSRNFV